MIDSDVNLHVWLVRMQAQHSYNYQMHEQKKKQFKEEQLAIQVSIPK